MKCKILFSYERSSNSPKLANLMKVKVAILTPSHLVWVDNINCYTQSIPALPDMNILVGTLLDHQFSCSRVQNSRSLTRPSNSHHYFGIWITRTLEILFSTRGYFVYTSSNISNCKMFNHNYLSVHYVYVTSISSFPFSRQSKPQVENAIS